MNRRHAALLVIAVSSTLSLPARAQDDICLAGKVATPETMGHCCWPAQTWDEERAFCTGKPDCPAGTTRDGLTCVAARNPPPLPPPRPSSPAPVEPADTAAGGTWPSDQPTEEPPPPPKKKDNTGVVLAVAGGIAVGIGYVLALETAVTGISSQQDSVVCGMNPLLSYIPLVGPMLYTSSFPPHYLYRGDAIGNPQVFDCNTGRGTPIALAATSEVFQLTGAASLITGFVLMRRDAPKPTQTSSVVLHPGASGAPLGLTMTVTTF